MAPWSLHDDIQYLSCKVQILLPFDVRVLLNSFTGTRAFLFVEPGNVLGVVGVCGRWPKEKYDFASARAAAKSIAADNENVSVA